MRLEQLVSPPTLALRNSGQFLSSFGWPSSVLALPTRKEGRKEALGKRKRNRRREKERGEDACLPGIHYLGVGWGEGAYRLLNTRLIRREGESGVNVLICIHEPGWQNS